MESGVWGTPILEEGMVLMEIKTAGAIPLWVVQALSKNKIYKSSFSKYGNAYLHFSAKKQTKVYIEKGDPYAYESFQGAF